MPKGDGRRYLNTHELVLLSTIAREPCTTVDASEWTGIPIEEAVVMVRKLKHFGCIRKVRLDRDTGLPIWEALV